MTIGLLLLLFPISYSVFAQTGGPSEEEEQQEDATDFAGLTTFMGAVPITGENASDRGPAEIDEVDMTPADFIPLREITATAREAIQNNDTTAAYYALNSAENFLFRATSKIAFEGGQGNPVEMTKQLNSFQTHIDVGRDALVNGDNIKTMEEVNSLDVGLFNVTRSLDEED